MCRLLKTTSSQIPCPEFGVELHAKDSGYHGKAFSKRFTCMLPARLGYDTLIHVFTPPAYTLKSIPNCSGLLK